MFPTLVLVAIPLGLVAGLFVYRLLSRSQLQPPSPAGAPEYTQILSGMQGSGETEGSYSVVVVNPGPNKIELIKAVRAITGASLIEAKPFAERPGMALSPLNHDVALRVSAKLQEAGATVSVQDSNAPEAPQPASSEAPSQRVTIEIVDPGPNKIEVIRIMREATGLGLREAMATVEQGRLELGNVNVAEAQPLKAALEAAGATVRIRT